MNNVESVKEQLKQNNLLDNYIELPASTATVEKAAAALNCEPGRIAKTLSFKTKEGVLVVLAMGCARVSNQKFKDFFKEKPRFLHSEEVQNLTGHPIGGVCPFALKEGVKIYLDESLKTFDPVYPAAGAPNNAVKISLADLQRVTGGEWVDVCSVPAAI